MSECVFADGFVALAELVEEVDEAVLLLFEEVEFGEVVFLLFLEDSREVGAHALDAAFKGVVVPEDPGKVLEAREVNEVGATWGWGCS